LAPTGTGLTQTTVAMPSGVAISQFTSQAITFDRDAGRSLVTSSCPRKRARRDISRERRTGGEQHRRRTKPDFH